MQGEARNDSSVEARRAVQKVLDGVVAKTMLRYGSPVLLGDATPYASIAAPLAALVR